MAQRKDQKQVMERVMHEFKEGELKSGGGEKVTDRRQAVAIGLSESGSSNQQTPAENRKRLAKARRDARGDGPTRAELYAEAKRRGVAGRSKMTKAELERALR
jgi:hypothetical protein